MNFVGPMKRDPSPCFASRQTKKIPFWRACCGDRKLACQSLKSVAAEAEPADSSSLFAQSRAMFQSYRVHRALRQVLMFNDTNITDQMIAAGITRIVNMPVGTV